MSRHGDDDQPARRADDEWLIGQDYEFEDALEKEWREIYGDRSRRRSAPGTDREKDPADPAMA
ncbi:hypothetical protein [Microbacterium invictum]|uniref:Uncharacterized protein n=1 Tax=Microbacterium invictum TaxID=515415 RepID=A0AA40VLS9_9MICO|nr:MULTISPECIES: hypothetical protein [Microbacterium]MBB4139664.1 hypothetical protein [Microbacterium invictum]